MMDIYGNYKNAYRIHKEAMTKLLLPHICLLQTKPNSQALLCQREQSLRDNLIVFSASAVFDVSGMVATEQTIILLISLVFLATYYGCDIHLKLPDQTLNSI